MAQHTIVVRDGDQTGQELLLEGLRVLQPSVTKVDLDLAHFSGLSGHMILARAFLQALDFAW